ncbi:hypothetical protein BLNAU_1496 [Blattamonas nauphoetae]|uniref:Uncharacterized protein n=1 Tax=Blattamonas nauphoetae TaxID=2049346 RepID=A0ABQ9YIP1_9EUKA|nr:hypothetical protein BLNAU_1496 [Blattamonas nauphoetae]
MQTVRCRRQPQTRLGLLSFLIFIILSSLHSRPLSFSSDLVDIRSLLCGGSLSSQEVEGVLSSGIVESLCTRLESESGSVDVLPTLLVLDRLCSGLKRKISSTSQPSESDDTTIKGKDDRNEHFAISDRFSLNRRCGLALSRIEIAVFTYARSLEGIDEDYQEDGHKHRDMQKEVGGLILRHFSASIASPSPKEIGEIGIDLVSVRSEMDDKMRQIEAEREKMQQSEELRQREFSMKMREMEAEREKEKREMEEMKKFHEKWIEEGRKREEEKKRGEERKREEEEEERRRNVKEGAAAIEVFQHDKFTLAGNVFTKSVTDYSFLFSPSFGPVIARITFIIRSYDGSAFATGLIATNMVEQAMHFQGWFSSLKGGASWALYPSSQHAHHQNHASHLGSACKAGAVGQRVVMEADGREGIRSLKLSQDGVTQPVFFTNIPVPFRFGIYAYKTGHSVEIVSSEVLREPSMVGGTIAVSMDE